MSLTRRDAILGLGAVVGGAAMGCGADPAEDSGGVDAATGGLDPRDAAVPPPDAPVVVPPDAPTPDAPSADALLAPIDTFVVLMMENRSFDHYLGALSLFEGHACDGLTGAEVNFAVDGRIVPVHRLDDFTVVDPPHLWEACHQQWNGGANDGFVRAHAGPSESDVMGYHVRSQLPITYALADQGAICDRWFASVMGPTWPNRFYLHGATSLGNTFNLPAFGFRSIFAALDDAGLSHKNYFHDVPWAAGGYFKLAGNAPIEDFFADAAAGTLPTFSIIDPKFFGAGANDDHPDHDVRAGQALIAAVVRALGASPQWGRCLLVVTYDEHGGFFDHVPPPTTIDERADFRQLGFRVPSLVIGPTVRRGQTVHTQFDHGSVISTVTRRFGLAPLNDRIVGTADLSSCIDPRWLAQPQAAPDLPVVPMSRAEIFRRPLTASHPELAAAFDAMALPPTLDRRSRSHQVVEAFLHHAGRLGAVRLID